MTIYASLVPGPSQLDLYFQTNFDKHNMSASCMRKWGSFPLHFSCYCVGAVPLKSPVRFSPKTISFLSLSYVIDDIAGSGPRASRGKWVRDVLGFVKECSHWHDQPISFGLRVISLTPVLWFPLLSSFVADQPSFASPSLIKFCLRKYPKINIGCT
jgi:hypothetical protein